MRLRASSNTCSDLLHNVSSSGCVADKRHAYRNVPAVATTAGAKRAESQSLDPQPAQDYIAAVMMNDIQNTTRRRRAKTARAYVFV
jgi:hypothetical protein